MRSLSDKKLTGENEQSSFGSPQETGILVFSTTPPPPKKKKNKQNLPRDENG